MAAEHIAVSVKARFKKISSEVAVCLIKKGADINAANEKQETPMQIAVEKGMDEVLAFL